MAGSSTQDDDDYPTLPLRAGAAYLMQKAIRFIPDGYDPIPVVNYTKGAHNFVELHEENPWEFEKHVVTKKDVHFWTLF